MNELGKGFDGTVEKAISSTEKLKNLPKILQKYMMWGDYKSGLITKIDGSKFGDSIDGENIQNYVAQISNLDKAQRNAIISVTKLDKESKAAIQDLIDLIQTGSRINGKVFESSLKSAGNSEINQGDINSLMNALGMKNGDNYALPDTNEVKKNLNMWAKAAENADAKTRLMNAGIIESTKNGYAMTDSFKKMIGIEEVDGAVKTALTAEQQALNIAMALGKQLMLSLGIAAVTFGIQKLVGWLANLKSHSDQILVDMSDAHDKAEQAQNDIDNVNQQLEDLNKQIKDAGADSIDDIVDPNERKRIQVVNDSLQAQLKLKQQILEINKAEAKKKAEEAYNDKTETSIEKYHTVDEITDNGVYTHNEGDQVTKADSLAEHARQLDNLIDKRKQYETTEGYEDSADYLKNENEIGNEIEKINTLSASVSWMQENLDETSDAYQSCTDSINLATDALAYSNGNIDISATKVSQLADKIKELDASSKSYYDTVTTNQKYVKYGNIDNTNRGVIRWTKENLNKYSQFAEENGVEEGGYSTVLGSKREFNNVGMVAFSPMLQTKDGVVPLTDSEVSKYLDDVISKASKMDGGATADNILKVDADGITETVAGTSTKVKGMIAAVEGQIKDGVTLTAADVAAISGDSTEDLQNEFGETSKYIGYSMHDIQKSVEEMGNGVAGAIANIQDQIPKLNKNILAQMLMTEGTGFTEKTQKGFEILYEQMNALGFEVNTENCKLFAAALERLGYISDTTADRLAKVAENKDKLEEATTGLKNIQTAYSTLSSVVDEYNKNGYLTVSTLSSLIDLGPEYYDCLVDESGQLAINTENINTMADAYYEMAKAALYAQAIESLNSNTNTYANASKFLEQAQQEVKDMKSLLYAEGQRLIDEGGLSGDALATQVKAQERIINTYSAMIELLDKTHAQSTENQFRDPKDKSSSNSSKKNTTDPVSAWKTMSAAMEEYNQQGALCVSTLTSLMDLEDEYTSLLDVKNGKMELSTSEFKNLMLAEIAQANASDDSGKSAAEFKKILEWVDGNVKENTISYWQLVAAIEGYSAALEKAKGITDTFKDAWSNGNTIKEKQEKSRAGALDYEGTEAQSSALQDLMKYSEYDPELIGKAFNKETGKIDLSRDVLKTAVAESLKQQAAAARTEGGAAAEAIAASYEKSAENIENDVVSVQDYFDGLGSTIEKVSSKIDELQSAWSDLGDVANEYNTYGGLSVDSIQKLLTMSPEYLQFLKMDGDQLVFNRDAMLAYAKANLLTKAAELELKDETKDQAEILRALANSLDKGADSMDGMGSSAEKLKSGLSDLKDVFSSLLSLFEKFNTDKDNDLKLWGEAMTEDIDKRIEALNKQKEALEKANDEEERAITLAKLKAELEKARTQRTVRKLTSNGYEWVADESAVKEAKDNLSDQQREWRKEDAEKAIDDQIDKLNELKDKYSEAMNLIGTSLDDYNKKLRYAAQIQDMTFSEMEGRVDEYKNKIVASFTSAAPVSGIQNLISNIESLIDTLTKLNNVYSWIQTGEYQDKGTKGLWNTIKGFFNKGKSEKINKSFKDTFNAAKKAFNAGKKQLTDTATTGTTDVINAIINQIKTSGNGLVETFGGIWEKIKLGAQNLFRGSGEDGGIVSTVVDGFKAIGNVVSKSKIGSTLIKGAGKLVTGAGGLIKGAVGAIGAAGASAIPVVGGLAAAAGLGIYSGVKGMKHQKEIWSNKEDGFGKKAMKSVATFFWDISPIGGIVNLCKDIFGKNKEIADNTKDNGKDNTSSGTTNSSEGVVIGNIKGKKAAGSKSIKQSGRYNVDELGPELIVRQPTSGRYTYLETGDGVIPADITSRLFDMGGNPDRWFTKQMERNAGISNVQNRTIEGDKITIGDIYIQNPVGGVDDLAREINQRMPAMYKQIQSKR